MPSCLSTVRIWFRKNRDLSIKQCLFRILNNKLITGKNKYISRDTYHSAAMLVSNAKCHWGHWSLWSYFPKFFLSQIKVTFCSLKRPKNLIHIFSCALFFFLHQMIFARMSMMLMSNSFINSGILNYNI